MESNKLYTYTLVFDSGFAPNPYFGMLTLATCKPGVRPSAKEGDWISGWCGTQLNSENDGKLIYLAKVEKKITFEEYWEGKEYEAKKSPITKEEYEAYWANGADRKDLTKELFKKYGVALFGDNIYDAEGKQQYSVFHNQGSVNADLKGEFVLVCKEFYYFGHKENCLATDGINIIPLKRGFNCNYDEAEVAKLIDFVKQNADKALIPNEKVDYTPILDDVCNGASGCNSCGSGC